MRLAGMFWSLFINVLDLILSHAYPFQLMVAFVKNVFAKRFKIFYSVESNRRKFQ